MRTGCVGKPGGQSPLERPRRRWKGNFKMVVQEIGLERGLNLSGSGQGHVAVFFVNSGMNIRFPKYAGNF